MEQVESALAALPRSYQAFRDMWADPAQRQQCLDAYTGGQTSFVPNLLPELALELTGAELLAILKARYGGAVDLALDLLNTDPDNIPAMLPAAICSPARSAADGSWLKHSNMIGINLRTVGSFWDIVKYTLTLPAAQDAIHLLPIWEPGVVGSLYGMSSWQLNREFHSTELAALCPWLDTTERQLRAVVNLLHVMGRTVGMDVIPHTDRFSEIVLSHPEHFEWLQRQDTLIVDHTANLHVAVQDQIVAFLQAHGPAVPGLAVPAARADFFGPATNEAQRLAILFGNPDDTLGRQSRRNQLITQLARYGYEPVPATMAPPYRGIEVDRRPEAKSVDANGQIWREYATVNPTPMSRVFGPLARYKLYEPRDDNADWQLDFSRPRVATWDYICAHYGQAQQRYGLDFMRGDMAHVQMRPHGVPATLDRFYDILGAVKQYVRDHGAPHFGYFAETFLASRDVFGYGEEIDHLEAANADTTLGDLQSTVPGTAEFLRRFRYYDDLRTTRLCVPSFTTMTADKDDPRFDMFYQSGNEARMFLALFLTATPSYTGLGFETRDVHYEPAPNEHYTKLYVFQETGGPKATQGPYVWGRNGVLFGAITRMYRLSDAIWRFIAGQPTRWLIAPDATGENPIMAWTQLAAAPTHVFIVNTSATKTLTQLAIPQLAPTARLSCVFSTHTSVLEAAPLTFNGKQHQVPKLAAGEGRVYRVGQ